MTKDKITKSWMPWIKLVNDLYKKGTYFLVIDELSKDPVVLLVLEIAVWHPANKHRGIGSGYLCEIYVDLLHHDCHKDCPMIKDKMDCKHNSSPYWRTQFPGHDHQVAMDEIYHHLMSRYNEIWAKEKNNENLQSLLEEYQK